MDFDFHREGPACVVLAHGLTGDRSMGGRFDRLRAGLAAAGLSSLAFDFSRRVTLPAHVEELREAIAFARGSGCAPVALFGQSWGALVCTEAAPSLPMVLAAPPAGAVLYRWEDFYSPRQLSELRSTGAMNIGSTSIPQETFDLFARLQPPQLQRPALILHGDQGWEEQTLLANSRAAMHLLPAGTRLEVLAGADHSLRARYDDVVRLAVEWLSRELRLE